MWAQALQIGAQVVGGLIQGSAAERAKDAGVQGQMQARQDLARANEGVRTVQDPYLQSGYAAQNALTGRLGLPTQGVSSAINNASIDPAAYLQAYPDVMAEAQRVVGNGEFASFNDYARWHMDNYGGPSGRLDEMRQQQPMRAEGALPSSQSMDAPGSNALTGSANGNRVYGNVENPSYTAPEAFSFDINSFKDNPAYKFALEQGTGQVLASAAATGALQSGAALKELQDRGQKTAYNFYAPERNFAFNQYTDARNFDRGVYENDRGYLTNRDDRQTDDLFRMSEQGRGSAGIISNALLGQGTANANSQIAQSGLVGSNALTQGNLWGNVIGNVAGSAGQMLNGRRDPLAGLY